MQDEWSRAFALLGAYGYRPKLTPDALVGYRADGSVFALTARAGALPVRRYDSTLCLVLSAGHGTALADERFPFHGDDDLIRQVLAVLARHPDEPQPGQGFIRYFPPESELDRMLLAAAYASYRP